MRAALGRVGALVLAGLLLRLIALTGRSLWLDESIQVHVAAAPDLLVQLAQADLHPPLSAWLTRTALLLGDDDLTLRLPSLVASLATIPLLASAGRAWSTERAASFAGAAAAVLPPLVLYGGEARPYALGVALLAWFVGAVGAHATWTAVIAGTLAVLCQYGAWPVVAVGAVVAIRRDGHALAWSIPATVAVALGLTLLPEQLSHQGAGLRHGFLADAFFTPATLPSWALRQLPALFGWLLTGTSGRAALVVGGALIALLGVGARGRRPDALTVVAWGPVLALIGLAGLGLHPLGPSRHALVLLPGLLVWGARRVEAWAVPAAAVVGSLAGAGLVVSPSLPREDTPGLVAALDALDDLPVIADGSAAPQLSRYARRTVVWLPWVRGPRLQAELDAAAPTGPFWFAVGSAGDHAMDDAEAWALETGRTLGPRVERTGLAARRIGPAAP